MAESCIRYSIDELRSAYLYYNMLCVTTYPSPVLLLLHRDRSPRTVDIDNVLRLVVG